MIVCHFHNRFSKKRHQLKLQCVIFASLSPSQFEIWNRRLITYLSWKQIKSKWHFQLNWTWQLKLEMTLLSVLSKVTVSNTFFVLAQYLFFLYFYPKRVMGCNFKFGRATTILMHIYNCTLQVIMNIQIATIIHLTSNECKFGYSQHWFYIISIIFAFFIYKKRLYIFYLFIQLWCKERSGSCYPNFWLILMIWHSSPANDETTHFYPILMSLIKIYIAAQP